MNRNNPSPGVMTTPFMIMLRNVAVVFLAFLICQPIFILYNRNALQGTMDGLFWPMLKGSLVFDTAGVMYLSAIYVVLMMLPLHFKEKLWWYKLTRIILIVMASAGIMANLVDTVYYQYTFVDDTKEAGSQKMVRHGETWKIRLRN